MKQHLATLRGLASNSTRFKMRGKGRDSLLFQRLLWGALTGCLAAVLWGESPILESMELTTLEWRYQISNLLANVVEEPRTSDEVSIVEFDDLSQFELGIARFNELRAQKILAKAIESIEQGGPTMVILDVDLRGACDADLVRVMKKYRNVVIALFGTLEGSSDYPSAEFLAHAAAYGYDELAHEPNGLIVRLQVNTKTESAQDKNIDESALAPVSSLTESAIDLHHKLKGVGPFSEFFATRVEPPVYIGFNQVRYPRVSLRDALEKNFNVEQFKDRIVFIGSTFTQRHAEQRRTPLQKNVPDVVTHADAVQCLLDNSEIFSFPKRIAHHLLLLLGAVAGALSAMTPLGRRTLAFALAGGIIILAGQIAFISLHLAFPIISPLAVLLFGFLVGTFIFLDTDLRQRNQELAEARLSMQVRAEEERQRIAEDLHDETLPALSSVARMADKLSSELDGNPVPQEMREKLDFAVTEMRRVINDLHPSVLETMGFKPALENLVSMLSRESSIDADFKDLDERPDYQLNEFTKLQLYRMVQEALNNVHKHAQAKNVEVAIGAEDGHLAISVIDNGRGIEPSRIRKDSHGLLNIRQRAQLLGAQVAWSKPEKYTSGTEFQVRIPLADEEQKL
jgi:signal transduction histidine kinase